MSAPDRNSLLDRQHRVLSMRRQCALGVARSGVYRASRLANDNDAALKRIDELFTKWPFYGSRRMTLCEKTG